jgi:hypothetical protein
LKVLSDIEHLSSFGWGEQGVGRNNQLGRRKPKELLQGSLFAFQRV